MANVNALIQSSATTPQKDISEDFVRYLIARYWQVCDAITMYFYLRGLSYAAPAYDKDIQFLMSICVQKILIESEESRSI